MFEIGLIAVVLIAGSVLLWAITAPGDGDDEILYAHDVCICGHTGDEHSQIFLSCDRYVHTARRSRPCGCRRFQKAPQEQA